MIKVELFVVCTNIAMNTTILQARVILCWRPSKNKVLVGYWIVVGLVFVVVMAWVGLLINKFQPSTSQGDGS